MPPRFSLYCELFRVPGIGESQSQAIVWFSVRRGVLPTPYLVLHEGAPNCPKWGGPGMRWRALIADLYSAAFFSDFLKI